ncbi:hypothetical protein [Paraclostridium sordellii]|uniref:hypothetical protein n=1 Tax=Paraclostridium sordellii TaxID=1505 RepID=UPI0005DF7251|nr:hypothetical protein [Paeniclostridium sordellii]CEN26281.1 Uncharacterised protein [[Clostridium] sordellii] [Paeniclostridium sordellii]
MILEEIMNSSVFLNDIRRNAVAMSNFSINEFLKLKEQELGEEKIREISDAVNQNELKQILCLILSKYIVYDSNSLDSLAKSMKNNFWKNQFEDMSEEVSKFLGKDVNGELIKFLEPVNQNLDKINQNLEYHYKRMIYLNVFIVVDEYLRKILKYLYMYNMDWIKDKKLILSIDEVANNENFEEIKENLIDEFTNNFNIEEKIKRINWIIRNKFELEPFDDEVVKEIKVYRIERNALVHAEGVILEKDINDLMKIDAKVFKNLKKDELFTYEIEKTLKMITLFMCLFEDLQIKIQSKVEKDIFGKILFYDKPSILKKHMNSEVFKKYSEFVK